MFEYFDRENYNNYEIVDIWKKFKITIDTDNYTYHKVSEGDNLMNISFNYYNTHDDWWVIYLFNGMNNQNFDFIPSTVLRKTLEKYRYLFNNYNTLLDKEKGELKRIVRNYFISLENSKKESITLTDGFINDLHEDNIDTIIQFIESDILTNSYYNTELKIPDMSVVFEIKNKFEDLSDIWNNK